MCTGLDIIRDTGERRVVPETGDPCRTITVLRYIDLADSHQAVPRLVVAGEAIAFGTVDKRHTVRHLLDRPRIDLFGAFNDPHKEICALISGHRYTDEEIASTMRAVYKETGYILDPHGACGYQGLLDSDLSETETGLFLETAHPAKFKGTVDKILEADIEIPAKLKAFMEGTKQSIELAKDFEGFKSFLMSR